MISLSIGRKTTAASLFRATTYRYVQRPLSTSHALRAPKEQSVSPLAPIGVAAAYDAKQNPSHKPRPKIFDEFALSDRVGIVSGGNRGLGLEMALALCEAGARAIYCFDLPETPSEDWQTTKEFVERLGNGSRLEYVSVDATNQEAVWKKGEEVGDKEKRMDVCIAAAGILKAHTDCLEYPSSQFQQVMNVNVNGVLFTAQAAGRQMRRFGNPGSIILIASMSGTITNRDHAWVSYNSSKSAVLQMTRSMACELAKENIRVNSLSPGHIYTKYALVSNSSRIDEPYILTKFDRMTAAYLDSQPHLLEKWSNLNPMGRIGRSDEMRGVVTWLASDASSFCTGSDILVSGGHHSW
ncbi:hypothetical protein V5O48_003922 [Marasmius crinis-equi]|uniref:Sorbose reductase sou1 n=1 Tax=Marasmius crinis-equi TaxID=585013 RepID=A0ABR3FS97_9AGAR